MSFHALTRFVVACYPPPLRRAYGDDLALSVEQCWQAHAQRGWRAGVVALMRLLGDVWRSWIGFGAERRWLGADATGSSPQGPRFGRHLIRDTAAALRAFRSARGFYAAVVATLALGIGANAAVFSLVRAVVLQPLPYERPHEIVMVWITSVVPDESWRHAVTPRYLLGWRTHAGDVADVAGVKGVGNLAAQMDLETAAGTERLRGAMATANFFDVLGASALHGRVFTAADEAFGADTFVVISHALWRRAFNADPGVVGQTVILATGWGRTRQQRRYTVLGVLPERFRFTYPEEVEVWTLHPWAAIAADDQDAIQFQVVGRLREGVSFEHAHARFAALHEAIRPDRADLPRQFRRTTRLERIHDWVVDDARPAVLLLSAVSALLLLITCATTANALFIRVSERRREIVLRSAVGASRASLLRQLLTEGLVLSAAGTAVGLALALTLLPVLRRLVPPSMPRADEIGIDASTFLFGAVAVAIVTLLATLVPAWRGATAGIADALKRSAAAVSVDRATSRWRRSLVAVQGTIAAALLVVCGLLLFSLWRLVNVPLGFEPGDLLAVEMRVIGPDVLDRSRLGAIQDAIVTRVGEVPGVAAVAATTAVPFRGVDWRVNVDVGDEGQSVGANQRHVDPEYFALLQMRPTRGRLFTRDDRAGAPPVAVVSESFARAAFGAADPIGRVFGEKTKTTIVGVVEDVRYATLRPVPALAKAIYVPRAQRPSELICLLVQPAPGARDLSAAIRTAIRDAAPALPAMGITSVASIIAGTLAERRFYTATIVSFTALALVLTVAGVAVVVLRALVERRQEMAIRAALGATIARLRARVLWEGLHPILVGVPIGLALAWAGATWLAPFLFEIDPRAAGVYVAVGAVLLAVALAGGWIAARRAAQVAPAVTLRE